MIRTIIIDDEAHVKDTLRKMLAMYCPQVSVVGEADGVAKGVREIQQHQPDLVFLDINLQDGTGFDLLSSLDNVGFSTIFISANDRDKIQAIKPDRLEFLVKPINPLDLAAAVEYAEKSGLGKLALTWKVPDRNRRRTYINSFFRKGTIMKNQPAR